jgi:hypothetical protein
MLGHFILAMTVGMVLIPVAVLGPERAVATTETFVNQTILPGLTNKPGALSQELTDITSTDNQSVLSIIHTAVHWSEFPRPRTADRGTKLAHMAVALLMVVWTFRATRRIADERYRTLFLLSGLTIVAVAVTPVNHTHYMALAIPAVLGLVYWDLETRGKFAWGPGLVLVVAVHVASGIWPRIPNLPGYQAARDLGVTMMGTLLVWYASLRFPRAKGTPAPAPGPAPTGGLRLPGVSVFK